MRSLIKVSLITILFSLSLVPSAHADYTYGISLGESSDAKRFLVQVPNGQLLLQFQISLKDPDGVTAIHRIFYWESTVAQGGLPRSELIQQLLSRPMVPASFAVLKCTSPRFSTSGATIRLYDYTVYNKAISPCRVDQIGDIYPIPQLSSSAGN